MSAFLGQAEAIKTRLEAETALSSASVVVCKNQDLESEVNKALAKVKGAAILITFQEATFNERNLTTDSRYIIEVVTQPILTKDEASNIELVESVIKSLHKWHDSDNEHCMMATYVKSAKFIQDQTHSVHEISIETKVHIT